MNKSLKRKLQTNETYVFLIIVALSILIEVRSGQFFTPNNIVDLLSALIVPGLFAIGTFLVILTGGIDVSFPALASLSTYSTTKFLLDRNYQGSIWVPILMAVAIGVVLGALNGLFIGYFDLPALIVTLGTSSVFKGIMQGALQSRQLAVIPKGMKDFGTSSLFTAQNKASGLTSNLPTAFLVLIVVLIIVFFVLRYTMFGRGIYAIGGNESAAYNAGFKVKRTKFLLYVFAGAIASIAGVIRTSMMQQMHHTNMLGMEMNIIAGVVLGGTAMIGGKGTLLGCMLGTFLMVIVENSLILIGVPVIWKDVFVGLLIIAGTAVSAYRVTHVGSSKKHKKLAKGA